MLVDFFVHLQSLRVHKLVAHINAILDIGSPPLELDHLGLKHSDTLFLSSETGAHLRPAKLHIEEVLELFKCESSRFAGVWIGLRIGFDHILNALSVRQDILRGQFRHQVLETVHLHVVRVFLAELDVVFIEGLNVGIESLVSLEDVLELGVCLRLEEFDYVITAIDVRFSEFPHR